MSDWYAVSPEAIKYRGGQMLFRYYPSLESLLQAVYPNHSWESSKFEEKEVRGKWKLVANQRHLLDKVGPDLGVKEVFLFPPPPPKI